MNDQVSSEDPGPDRKKKSIFTVIRKTFHYSAYVIAILFVLCLFAGMGFHVGSGGRLLGPLTPLAREFSEFPSKVKDSAGQLFFLDDTFQKTDRDFRPVNRLDRDVHVLYSFTHEGNQRKIVLKNLRDDREIRSWVPQSVFEVNRKVAPFLLGDEDLILCEHYYTLMRVGPSGKIKWKSQPPHAPHHSIALDAAGDLWTAGARVDDRRRLQNTHTLNFGDDVVPYHDDLILRWDAGTGRVLYAKSVTELFLENDLLNLLKRTHYPYDPFHLNDVVPVLSTTKHFRKGDLLLSFRHISAILQFRPEGEKVVRVLQGEFSLQHDVDLLSDGSLSILNNNGVARESKAFSADSVLEEMAPVHLGSSNVLRYDPETREYAALFPSVFSENRIYTHTEGAAERLEDGSLFFEEQNRGILWILDEQGVRYRNVIPSPHEGYHHLLNWTKVVKS